MLLSALLDLNIGKQISAIAKPGKMKIIKIAVLQRWERLLHKPNF